MGLLLGRRASRVWAKAGRLVALAAAAAAWGGCGPQTLAVPPVPTQLEAVAVEYDQPTGTVPPLATTEIADLQQKLMVVSDSDLADVVSDALSGVGTRLDDAGLTRDPNTVPKAHRPTFTATVLLDRTCRGWDDSSTTPDAANGSLELNAQVEQSTLERILWGTASTCHARVDVTGGVTVHPYVDGALGVYLYTAIPHSITEANFLLAVDGTLGTQSAQGSVAFDFRFRYPQVEVRIAVPDGTIIGSIGANAVTLRGKNGTFGCSLETFECGAVQTVSDTRLFNPYWNR